MATLLGVAHAFDSASVPDWCSTNHRFSHPANMPCPFFVSQPACTTSDVSCVDPASLVFRERVFVRKDSFFDAESSLDFGGDPSVLFDAGLSRAVMM